MSDLSSTQFFQVEPGPQISAKDIFEIQSGESDRWIYHVRRSDIHYKF